MRYPKEKKNGPATTPVFTGELEKLRGHWDAFVEYKSSELGLQKVHKAKNNALKKVYHHTLGQGGYKLAIPKWEKMEQDPRHFHM